MDLMMLILASSKLALVIKMYCKKMILLSERNQIFFLHIRSADSHWNLYFGYTKSSILQQGIHNKQ